MITPGTEQVLIFLVKLEWMAMEYAVLLQVFVFAAAKRHAFLWGAAGKCSCDLSDDGICG